MDAQESKTHQKCELSRNFVRSKQPTQKENIIVEGRVKSRKLDAL